jgi:hypothetical protein
VSAARECAHRVAKCGFWISTAMCVKTAAAAAGSASERIRQYRTGRVSLIYGLYTFAADLHTMNADGSQRALFRRVLAPGVEPQAGSPRPAWGPARP